MDKETKDKNYFLQAQIMTPKDTAQYLNLHIMTVYRLVKKGKLPGFKIGGQWRFKKDFLDEWILIKINEENKTKE